MKTSKVVQIISVLNETEIEELDDFINSPYFNSNSNIIKLFGLLKKQYPDLNPVKIEKEIIYGRLFEGKPYNEQIMKNLSSQLLQLTLEFLGINKYRNRNFNDKELDILSELNIKRLDNIFEIKLKKIEKDLLDSTHMIHPLFFHLHKLETIKTQFLLARDKQKQAADNVMKTGDYLIYFFITELTRIAIDLNANITSFNVKHSANLVHEVVEKFDFRHIIKFLQDNNYLYSEILNVYYHRLMALLESSDETYYNYKNLLIKNLDNFSLPEMATLIDSLHTIAIQRVNDGAEHGLREEFEVINLKLERNTLALNTGGKISMLTFRNVIFSSVRLNEIEWAERFIEKYIDMVNKESRESIYSHSWGIIAYIKKDYNAAIAHLSKVDLTNPFFISDVKTHMAIIFFEQGFYDSCISTLDSFRHILTNREEFTRIFKEVNIYFINALTALIKVKSGGKKEDSLLKIKEKLNSLKMVNHKGWLLRKTDELIAEN
ncbi:MAG: hypothetical protein ABI543_06895 [Ignavibacteria bacterium]